jgi:hypothetical protein
VALAAMVARHGADDGRTRWGWWHVGVVGVWWQRIGAGGVEKGGESVQGGGCDLRGHRGLGRSE